jgi:hypothetical protein
MRSGRPAAKLRRVSEPLRVGVEFDATNDPIAGWLTDGTERRPFTGWLGLISALERAIVIRQVADAREGPQGVEGPRETYPMV